MRYAEEGAARGSEDRLVETGCPKVLVPALDQHRVGGGSRGARAQRPLACRAGLWTPAWGVGVPALVGWLCPGQSEGVASSCSTFAPRGRGLGL